MTTAKPDSKKEEAGWPLSAVVLLLAAALEFALFILYRQINLDEGWYILASRLAIEGKVLYRDFAYTQTPLLPYVYGLILKLIGEGLYQGRVITAAFGLAAFGLSALIAKRRGGPWAGLLTLALLMTSLYAIAQFTYTATYGLSSALMMAALALALPDRNGTLPSSGWRVLAGMGLMWLAVAARLSVVAAILPYGVYVVLANENRRKAALSVVTISIILPLLFFGPFAAIAGPQFSYDIFGFHTDRMISATSQLGRMIDSSLATFGEFFVLWAVGLGAWLVWAWRAIRQRNARAHGFELVVGAMALALFAAHLAPRTTGSFYHSLEAPLLAILGGVGLSRMARRTWRTSSNRLIMSSLIVVLLLANLGLQVAALRRYNVFGDFPFNQIRALQAAADFVNNMQGVNGELVTFDTPLAIAAGRDVPPGFEMSIFAYRPNWSSEKSQQFRVINNEMLLDHMRASQDIIALTDYDLRNLYGDPQALRQTLLEHYRLTAVFPGLDPLGDDLFIYLPKGMSPPPPAHSLTAELDDGITLAGYDLQDDSSKDELRVALTWRAVAAPEQSYTAFVQLLDANQNYVTGWDNPPCQGTCPTDEWSAGETIRDEYVLPLPDGLTPGVYLLETGMYRPEDGTRLPVRQAQTTVTDDRIRLQEIVIR
ncbi:MAG: hypothetical protein J5I90_05760 [Caldilineales bacterium]|nr:hypothetical protein [Caldilineales bacterium]